MLDLAQHICWGEPWHGFKVEQGRVLYVDSEMDKYEAERRAHRLARGHNRDSPPKSLYYNRLKKSLRIGSEANKVVVEKVLKRIEHVRPVLVIIESWLMATGCAAVGGDPLAVVNTFQMLREWADGRSIVMIEHESQKTTADPEGMGAVDSAAMPRAVREVLLQAMGRIRRGRHQTLEA
jgi:RecA-family ATPase